jgi:hypothetical protein
VHPFWSSHEEKRACVRLSMGGGHGRSWSFHGSHAELAGEGKEGEGEEEAGAHCWGCHGERERVPWGEVARSNSVLVAAVRVFWFLREKKETTRRREEREEKKEKRKKKKIKTNGRNL